MTRFTAAIVAAILFAFVTIGVAPARAATTYTGTAIVVTGGQTFSVPATATVSNSGTNVTGIAFASDALSAGGSFDLDTGNGWTRISTLPNSAIFQIGRTGSSAGEIYGPPAPDQYRDMNPHSKVRVTLYNQGGPHVYVQSEGTTGTANFSITFIGS